ncbi:MAG: tRNA (cytidine(34)-2'-O)-methyltransferase [Vicinamibacteria bacterium]
MDLSKTPPGARSLHVVLVEPEIHWNTGNAGRSCLALGAQLHLIEPLGFSLVEKEVRRAGLDYWPRVKPRVWPSWASFESQLTELGEPYFVSPEAPMRIHDVRFPRKTVLVFGRESSGLPAAVREAYRDRLISIPMLDSETRSLNLSTCVGITLYEVLRQRQRASRS